jgi:hypothetical protein
MPGSSAPHPGNVLAWLRSPKAPEPRASAAIPDWYLPARLDALRAAPTRVRNPPSTPPSMPSFRPQIPSPSELTESAAGSESTQASVPATAACGRTQNISLVLAQVT